MWPVNVAEEICPSEAPGMNVPAGDWQMAHLAGKYCSKSE